MTVYFPKISYTIPLIFTSVYYIPSNHCIKTILSSSVHVIMSAENLKCCSFAKSYGIATNLAEGTHFDLWVFFKHLRKLSVFLSFFCRCWLLSKSDFYSMTRTGLPIVKSPFCGLPQLKHILRYSPLSRVPTFNPPRRDEKFFGLIWRIFFLLQR